MVRSAANVIELIGSVKEDASHFHLPTCHIEHLHTLCEPTVLYPNGSPSYRVTPIGFIIL